MKTYFVQLRSSNPSRLGWYSLDLQWQIWLLKTRAMLITGCSVNIVRNKACSSQREPITLGTSLIGSAMADMMVRAHRGCQYCLNLDRTTTTWRLSQRHTATGYRNSTWCDSHVNAIFDPTAINCDGHTTVTVNVLHTDTMGGSSATIHRFNSNQQFHRAWFQELQLHSIQ